MLRMLKQFVYVGLGSCSILYHYWDLRLPLYWDTVFFWFKDSIKIKWTNACLCPLSNYIHTTDEYQKTAYSFWILRITPYSECMNQNMHQEVDSPVGTFDHMHWIGWVTCEDQFHFAVHCMKHNQRLCSPPLHLSCKQLGFFLFFFLERGNAWNTELT